MTEGESRPALTIFGSFVARVRIVLKAGRLRRIVAFCVTVFGNNRGCGEVSPHGAGDVESVLVCMYMSLMVTTC
jgi:hypothetical protein